MYAQKPLRLSIPSRQRLQSHFKVQRSLPHSTMLLVISIVLKVKKAV